MRRVASRVRKLTDGFLQVSFGFNVALFHLVVHFLDCLQIFNVNPHFFDFLLFVKPCQSAWVYR